MSISIVDSYSETNQDSTVSVQAAGVGATTTAGQTFLGNGAYLTSAKFYLDKIGVPSGPSIAQLYATTGTYGTAACVPTGSVLATSSSIDVSTFGTSPTFALFEFTFSTGYVLTNGTPFAIVFDVTGNSFSGANRLNFGRSSAAGHSGNQVLFNGSWVGSAAFDSIFYVYGDQNTTTKTQTGVSRITAVTTKTQTGKARITVITAKTQTGKSRITTSTTKTQTGKARVTATTTRTQTGKGFVVLTRTKTQTGVSRILIPSTDTFTKPSLRAIDKSIITPSVSYEHSSNRGIGSNL